MKLELLDDCLIGEWFACYANYGESDGLNDQECRSYDEFEAHYREQGAQIFDWSTLDEDYQEFALCAVSGTRGRCNVVRIYK
jgi:hypothetical protein